jgi:hypothetical protein
MRGLICILIFVGMTLAQGSPTAEVVNAYRQFLGREPQPAEVIDQVNQLRLGRSIGEMQAQFLGSAEFFQRHGNNPQLFIVGAYGAVLQRLPAAAEIAAQLQGYAALNGDRLQFSRLFLTSAQAEIQQRAFQPAPPIQQNPAIQLVRSANRLIFAIRSEGRGNLNAQGLYLQSREFATASQALLNTINQGDVFQIQQVGQQVTAQYHVMHNTANQVLPFAPTTQALLSEIQSSLQLLANQPILNQPLPGPVAPPTLQPILLELCADTTFLRERCRQHQAFDPRLAPFTAIMENLVQDVESISYLTRLGRPANEVIPRLQFARQYQANLQAPFRNPRFDRVFRETWERIERDLNQLGIWVNVPLPPPQPMPPVPRGPILRGR